VADITTRIIAEPMRMSLGQPVVVDNVAGAGGSIGVGRAARAAPDGYTLSLGNWLTHVGASAIYPVQYDVLKDFEPISLLTQSPMWLVAKNGFPAKDLNEVVAWLKANPDKATAATVGSGSASHVTGVYFQRSTATRFQFVPYRGGAPAVQDVVAGHVDLMFAEVSSSLAFVRSGQIKAYAVMAKSRWFAAPETPTVDELGLPGIYLSFWQGVWAPKGTPKDILAKVHAAVVGALRDPAVRQRLIDAGQEVMPREQQTPEALAAFHKAEIEKWWPIIKEAGIKAE
jgi:tripartite-type tricarboxylate transporter receptor subunit TctC